MPLDYDAAPSAPAPGPAGPIDRGTVIAAVERYLAARGIAVAAAAGGPSCACDTPAPAAQTTASVVSNIAAEVVDRFLNSRGASGSKVGFS